MSYYERRIAELEARIAEMAKRERLKAIPVEAKLIDSIAELKAENERLRKAGDNLARACDENGCHDNGDWDDQQDAIKRWNAAKEVQS